MIDLLPWQQNNWQQVVQRIQQSRLPHALLLVGKQGTGKRQFAEKLAESLLCQAPGDEGHACGQCAACLLKQSDTHPDFHLLTPEEAGKAIKIDQVRQLNDKLISLKSHYQSGYKVAILDPADAMNTAAANSLLKTLEEPAERTIIILVSSRITALPATIRSRCQIMRMDEPAFAEALQWLNQHLPGSEKASTLLEMASGAPLTALDFAQANTDEVYQDMLRDWVKLGRGQGEPLKVADEWSKFNHNLPVLWVYEWISTMIHLKQGSCVTETDNATSELKQVAETVSIKQLFKLLDHVMDARRVLHSQVNYLMLLEGILLYWTNLPRQMA